MNIDEMCTVATGNRNSKGVCLDSDIKLINNMLQEISHHIYTEKKLNCNRLNNIILTMKLEEDLLTFVKNALERLDRIVKDYGNHYGLYEGRSLKERLAEVNQ